MKRSHRRVAPLVVGILRVARRVARVPVGLCLVALPVLALAAAAQNAAGARAAARTEASLQGPVRRVRVEVAPLVERAGRLEEGAHIVISTETYDRQGNKVEGAASQAPSAAGRVTYTNDQRGNPIEMTERDPAGQLLRKEFYTYEFDKLGNWVKRITSVGVVNDGKVGVEPLEVTYRYITYYLAGEAARQYAEPPPAAPPDNTAAASAALTPAAKVGRVEQNPPPQLDEAGRGNTAARGEPVSQPEAHARPAAVARHPPGEAVSPPAASTANGVPDAPARANTAPAPPLPVTPLAISSASKVKLNALLDEAEAAYKEGRYPDAIQAYLHAAEINPNDPVIYNNLAVTYTGLKKYKEALSALKLANAITPRDPTLHLKLGTLQLLLKNYREAGNELREALRLKPDWPQAHLALGLVYVMLGDRAAADAQVARLSKLDPKAARTLSTYVSQLEDPLAAVKLADICKIVSCQ